MSLLDDIAKKVDAMPLVSTSALRLMDIMSNKNHSLNDVVQVVECDAILTARVLRVVNSAAFGLRESIETVNRAVAYIGDRGVVAIAVSSCLGNMFDKPLEGYESGAGALWAHSLKTAIASRELASYAKNVDPGLAYTGGLLHGVGKAVLSEFLKGTSQGFISEMEKGEVKDYLEAEQKHLETDHTKVGEMLAKRWQLPEVLCEVIGKYLRPSEAKEEHRPLVHVVHLANFVAMMSGAGTGADAFGYKLDEHYPDYVKINSTDLTVVMARVQREFEKIATAIGHSDEKGA